ncbi:MAG: TolC family protein [Betaproteobacteria bacterium]|nr:TolC family protein [Betaproteobacteria bacterium]
MFTHSFRPANRHSFVLALALAIAAPSTQAGNALNFDQALRLAQDRSRQLPAQDAAATAAREMAVAAGQLPDPTLKVGVDNLPINGPDQFSLSRDFMTQRSIGMAQEFTRDDKRRARAARFDREAEAAQAGGALALANLQRDAAIAWLDRHYQERLREVLASQRDEARLQIDAAETAYRGGKGSQADVFAARTAAAQIDDRIAQAERQVATTRIQLARWVGDAATQPLGTPPATDTVRLDAADLETRLAHHPQIAVMVKQEEMAEADVQLARANRKADWSAELMFSQRGPAYSNMVSVNVSIPLQWDRKNRQDRELAAKLATAEQMRAQRDEASREHVAEALAMLEEWQSNRERLKRYDTSLIPLAADRTRAAIAAYRGGTAILSAVLDARRAEIDVRIERVRLEMETARLWAQLNYLIPAGHDVAAPRP